MDYELMMNGNVKIGQLAPNFNATTTMGNISLDDYKGKWVVLFSHPGDFTPVCTTEMIAFARANKYFEQLNSCLLGLSIDSNPSHLAWMYDIYCKTGTVIPFPIIADRSGEIARKYGMISSNISSTATVRNVFIIDDKQIVRTILVYPMNIGRNIPEILRIIKALQTADKNNQMAPANWTPCEPMILPAPQTFNDLQCRLQQIDSERNGMSWYLSFRNPRNCNLAGMPLCGRNCNMAEMPWCGRNKMMDETQNGMRDYNIDRDYSYVSNDNLESNQREKVDDNRLNDNRNVTQDVSRDNEPMNVQNYKEKNASDDLTRKTETNQDKIQKNEQPKPINKISDKMPERKSRTIQWNNFK